MCGIFFLWKHTSYVLCLEPVTKNIVLELIIFNQNMIDLESVAIYDVANVRKFSLLEIIPALISNLMIHFIRKHQAIANNKKNT